MLNHHLQHSSLEKTSELHRRSLAYTILLYCSLCQAFTKTIKLNHCLEHCSLGNNINPWAIPVITVPWAIRVQYWSSDFPSLPLFLYPFPKLFTGQYPSPTLSPTLSVGQYPSQTLFLGFHLLPSQQIMWVLLSRISLTNCCLLFPTLPYLPSPELQPTSRHTLTTPYHLCTLLQYTYPPPEKSSSTQRSSKE